MIRDIAILFLGIVLAASFGAYATGSSKSSGSSSSAVASAAGGIATANPVVTTPVRVNGGVANFDAMPSFGLGGMAPTSSCQKTTEAGFGNNSFIIGGGRSHDDPECDLREAVRLADGIGQVEWSKKLFCNLEVSKTHLARDCKQYISVARQAAAHGDLTPKAPPKPKKFNGDYSVQRP